MVKPTFLNLPEDKRRRIIEVALEEFASRPYSKASLSNIVARAGIAKGSMYQYFEDKKALYTYLLDMAVAEKMAYIGKEVQPDADFFTAIEQSMMAGVRFGLEHPQLSRVIANAMEPLGEEVLQELHVHWKRIGLDFFEQMLIRGQEQGVVRRDVDVRLAANLLNSILGVGLADFILDTLDSTMHDFFADPQSVNKLTDNLISHIITDIIKLLRSGLAGEGKC